MTRQAAKKRRYTTPQHRSIVSIAQGLVVLPRVSFTSMPFYGEALVPLSMGLGHVVWS
jgi:hypothetical protein